MIFMQETLEKQIREIEQIISREEQKGPIEKLSDLAIRHRAVSRIKAQITKATRTLISLRRHYLAEYEQDLDECNERVQRLSELPHHRDILWAQEVLRLPNLLLLVIDEDSEHGTMGIFRFLAVDGAGNVRFDRLIKPNAPLPEEISYAIGVTSQEIEEAASIQDIWADLLHTLSGKFVLTFDFEEFHEQIEIYAEQYDLERPMIFGTSFGEEVESYFHVKLNESSLWRASSLDQLCSWLSYPLPSHPQQTARERAKGYLHILQAMAQGVIIIRPREQHTDDEYDEWEDDENDWTDDEWEDERRLYEGQSEEEDDDEERLSR
jgi:hypothetical protein